MQFVATGSFPEQQGKDRGYSSTHAHTCTHMHTQTIIRLPTLIQALASYTQLHFTGRQDTAVTDILKELTSKDAGTILSTMCPRFPGF